MFNEAFSYKGRSKVTEPATLFVSTHAARTRLNNLVDMSTFGSLDTEQRESTERQIAEIKEYLTPKVVK